MKDAKNTCQSHSNTTKKHILLLILLWLFLIATLPWRGFFLLNDDYVYEWNVRHFVERGLKLHTYTSPTLIFQLILGVMVYAIRQDPSLLRLLTSIFFLLGTIYMYKLLLLEKITNKKALLLTLIMFFNPLYLHLGFTFMSEPYFLTTIIMSLYFFARYSQKMGNENVYAFLTMLFWTFAYLSRQVALFFLPAFFITEFFFLDKRKLKDYIKYLFPIGIFLVYELLIPKTLVYTQGSLLKSLESLIIPVTYIVAVERFLKTLFYFGFFTFPITLVYLMQKLKDKDFLNKQFLLIFIGTFCVMSGVAIYFWKTQTQLMFYIPNILTYAGFLPASLHMGIKQTFFVNSPVRAQALLTLISMVSFSCLVCMGFSKLEGQKVRVKNFIKPENANVANIFIATVISMVTFFLFRSYYDRYILVALPLLLILLGKWMEFKKTASLLAWILTGALAISSFAMEHDYLSLIKTVWEIPEKYGIEKLQYYSTFEFNAYHRLDAFADAQTMEEISARAWMPPREDYEFYASYTPIADFYVEQEINYKSLISPNFKGSLLLLKKYPWLE
ncbi:hypothetical protein KBG31_02195 [Patescibacteria group bacterium]|nr:hypothetical protein [Patescibacteria group bacterium]